MPAMRPIAFLCLATAVVPILLAASPQPDRFAELDKQVRAFLERNRRTWIDLNVPAADGQVLHDLGTRAQVHAGARDR